MPLQAGELWGALYESFGEKISRYIESTLYEVFVVVKWYLADLDITYKSNEMEENLAKALKLPDVDYIW